MANGEADPTLLEIADQLAEAKAAIPRAEDLAAILAEAGEDTTEVRALIIETKTRILRWEKMLAARGITIPSPTIPEEE